MQTRFLLILVKLAHISWNAFTQSRYGHRVVNGTIEGMGMRIVVQVKNIVSLSFAGFLGRVIVRRGNFLLYVVTSWCFN